MNRYTFDVSKIEVEAFEVIAENEEEARNILYGRATNDEGVEFIGKRTTPEKIELVNEMPVVVGEDDLDLSM